MRLKIHLILHNKLKNNNICRRPDPQLAGGAVRARARGRRHRGHQRAARAQPAAPRRRRAHQALRRRRHAHRRAARRARPPGRAPRLTRYVARLCHWVEYRDVRVVNDVCRHIIASDCWSFEPIRH